MRSRSASILIALAGAVLGTYIFWAAQPQFAETAQGEEIFSKRCTGCHALDRARTGPPLRGVYGRPAGSVPSFPYSESLRRSGITWDSSSLDRWLTDPDGFIPDNNMAFRVPNPTERTAIIDYLRGVSANEN